MPGSPQANPPAFLSAIPGNAASQRCTRSNPCFTFQRKLA
jgi:hypothetical protein